MPPTLDDEFTELVDADIPRVDLVGKAANGTRFLIAKSAAGMLPPELVRELVGKTAEPDATPDVDVNLTPAQAMALVHAASVRKADLSTADLNNLPDDAFAYVQPGGKKDASGRTVPRSLRHFAIHDADHVRDALSRAPQSPFGDKAMPKIKAAAKRLGVTVAKADSDDLDATTVLAEPDTKAPGNPDEPGSPAWEAVDAATARKWTSLLLRARNALGAMADREGMEAATADPDDLDAALDLQSAAAYVDSAVGILARFAVDEQGEADLAADDAEAVGKALAGLDEHTLIVLEAFAPVVKAGRALSAGNETAIRDAITALQRVLASLPQPTDDGPTVAKNTEETLVPDTTPAPADTEDETVVKAKGKPMLVVCDNSGNPIGVCDPADVMPIADGPDTAPAPAAPAVDASQDEAVIPGTQTVASPAPTPDGDAPVAKTADTKTKKTKKKDKAARLTKALEEALAPLTEELRTARGLAGDVQDLKGRVTKMGLAPDDRKSPLFNGADGVNGTAVHDGAADLLADLRKAVEDAPNPEVRREATAALGYEAIKQRFAGRL